MPSIDNIRITSGTGTVTFANSIVSNSTTTDILPALANAAVISSAEYGVLGQNVGNGIGVYFGASTGYSGVEFLSFKTLYGGIGISLTDLGNKILITATGQISQPYFIDLIGGPGDIVANSILISNGTSSLGWLSPPIENNEVLAWFENTITWIEPTSLFSFTGNGDNSISVSTQTSTNGVSFSVSLNNTTVIPGTYILPTIVIDQTGRVTEIANIAGLTPVTTFSIVTDGNILATPNTVLGDLTISFALANTTVVAGTYSFPTFIVDQYGRITDIESGFDPLQEFTIYGDADIEVIGMPANGIVNLALAQTTVDAGTYSLSTIIVDSNGRVQQAFNGMAVTGVSVVAGTDNNIIVLGNPISNVGTFSISLATTLVTPGTYSYANIEVDAYGRLQNAASGNLALDFTTISPNGISIYAGVSAGTQYFSALTSSANVSVSVTDTNLISGQLANSGVISLDLVDTGIVPGTYNTLIVDSKGRATFGALYEFNYITLVGDVFGNTSSFSPGGYTGGTYMPPTINTSLENVLPGPATFFSVNVDSKGRVIGGQSDSNFILTFDGDVSGSGTINNTITLTLENIGSEGTYTQVIVDDNGRVISGTAPGNVSSFVNLTGDVTAVGNATSLSPVTATLANTGVLAGTYISVSVDSKGRVLAGSNPFGNNGSILNLGSNIAYYSYTLTGGSQTIYTVDVPYGCNFIKATITGGGGSGAVNGTGGAAGGTVQAYFYNVNQGDYFLIAPGEGGASVSGTYSANGVSGQTSSVILYNNSATVLANVSVGGGTGGYSANALNGIGVPVGGGLLSTVTSNVAFGPVQTGGYGHAGLATSGGSSFWGSGGLGQYWNGTYTVEPFNAANYGAGGGGGGPSSSNVPVTTPSGAGGNGVVYLEFFYTPLTL